MDNLQQAQRVYVARLRGILPATAKTITSATTQTTHAYRMSTEYKKKKLGALDNFFALTIAAFSGKTKKLQHQNSVHHKLTKQPNSSQNIAFERDWSEDVNKLGTVQWTYSLEDIPMFFHCCFFYTLSVSIAFATRKVKNLVNDKLPRNTRTAKQSKHK